MIECHRKRCPETTKPRHLFFDHRPVDRVVHMPEHVEIGEPQRPAGSVSGDVAGPRGQMQPGTDGATRRGFSIQRRKVGGNHNGLHRLHIDMHPQRGGLDAPMLGWFVGNWVVASNGVPPLGPSRAQAATPRAQGEHVEVLRKLVHTQHSSPRYPCSWIRQTRIARIVVGHIL